MVFILIFDIRNSRPEGLRISFCPWNWKANCLLLQSSCFLKWYLIFNGSHWPKMFRLKFGICIKIALLRVMIECYMGNLTQIISFVPWTVSDHKEYSDLSMHVPHAPVPSLQFTCCTILKNLWNLAVISKMHDVLHSWLVTKWHVLQMFSVVHIMLQQLVLNTVVYQLDEMKRTSNSKGIICDWNDE